MKQPVLFLFVAMVVWVASMVLAQLPPDFVYLEDVDPTIVQDIRYYTHHNFMGRPATGYLAPKCILTAQAAKALSLVQQELLNLSYSLKVYDCYRPVMAVEDFVAWSRNFTDTLMKEEFYPEFNKSQLFPLGYIAYNSSHSRGSTADLTIIPNPSPPEENYTIGMPLVPCYAPYGKRFNDNTIDMGTGFDCFSTLANTNSPGIGLLQLANRHFLQSLMDRFNFVNLPLEWWHYTLADEPFPDTYFNFTIQ